MESNTLTHNILSQIAPIGYGRYEIGTTYRSAEICSAEIGGFWKKGLFAAGRFRMLLAVPTPSSRCLPARTKPSSRHCLPGLNPSDFSL